MVDAITVTPTHVFTGGRDCKINVLNASTYALEFAIDTSAFPGSVNAAVRAICLDSTSKRIFVGTFGHEIFEAPIALATKRAGQAKNLIMGHYAPLYKDNNEAWGLAVSQLESKDFFITTSDDGTLRVWDVATRRQIKCISLLKD